VKYEMQTSMFTGRMVDTEVPTGEVHIFQIDTDAEGYTIIAPYTMCGRERAKIGEQTKDSDKRPNNMPMCQKCEAAWKKNPDSPWSKWQKGKPL
jgi:hypothetical protein